jgi:nucleoside-diphosphate-sugar epimerase
MIGDIFFIMTVIVTGSTVFIGSKLTDRLLHNGQQVRAYDNLSTVRLELLEYARKSSSYELCEGDFLDLSKLKTAMTSVEIVFHIVDTTRRARIA